MSSQQSGGAGETPASGVDEASTTIVATVSSLVDVMSRGGITELDLDYLDVRIRLRGAAAPTGTAPPPAALPSNSVVPAAPAPAVGKVVTAPMVGTFYAAPTPQDPPFVEVGDTVRSGQVIGIIEAMKIMNEIASDADGVVSEILVSNGQGVEYGSELLRLVPASAAR